MSTIDQQFIEFIVKSLVGNPSAVSITRRIDEKGVLLELSVDPEDLGRVIGKRGATAQSIRTLLRALGTKNDARYNLKIVDTAVEGANATTASSSTTDTATNDSVADSADDTTTASDSVASDDSDTEEAESESMSKTRKELAELDDLDI